MCVNAGVLTNFKSQLKLSLPVYIPSRMAIFINLELPSRAPAKKLFKSSDAEKRIYRVGDIGDS